MQRMRGLRARVRDRSESGAVAIVFAVSLMMLLGFVGLGVDVAGAYAKTQEVQNAADAAALGMAQECAQEGDLCSETSPLAVDLADRNIRHGFTADPENALSDLSVAERVTVEVFAESETFFVGLFGIDSFEIAREATAAWDSPVKLTTMLPLTIGECEFDFHGGVESTFVVVNMTKSSLSDCDRPPSENDAPGSFGYIGGDTGCEVPVDINDPWVEGNRGNDPPNYCPAPDLRAVVDTGGTVLVPIFDACRVRNNNNNAPMCSVNEASDAPPAEFRIKGFAAFELDGFKFSGGGDYFYPKPAPGACEKNGRCIWGRFVEWVTLEDVDKWGEVPEDYGVQSVRLINP